MKYLRHPALAVWVMIVAVLTGVLLLAVHLGSSGRAPAPSAVSAPAVPATASSARGDVETLRTLMQSGVAAGVDLTALHAFGQRAVAVASASVAARTADGAAADDPLRATLLDAQNAARTVASATDVTTATSARSALALDVDTASALVSGLPMPVGGAPAAQPLPAGGAGTPVPPAVTAPHMPTLSTVPSSGSR